jgi:hypothetical protein
VLVTKGYVCLQRTNPVQASKLLPTISLIYGINPYTSQHCIGDVQLGEKKWDNKARENVKWLKGAKLEDLEMC